MDRVLDRFGEKIMPACRRQLDAENFIAVERKVRDPPQPHGNEQPDHQDGCDGRVRESLRRLRGGRR